MASAEVALGEHERAFERQATAGELVVYGRDTAKDFSVRPGRSQRPRIRRIERWFRAAFKSLATRELSLRLGSLLCSRVVERLIAITQNAAGVWVAAKKAVSRRKYPERLSG